MKKYVVRYAYATNVLEYLAGAEPMITIENCSKLPLATPLTDNVVFHKIDTIATPFSLDDEANGYLLHIEKSESGALLAFVDDVESVRAMMDELGGGKLHLGLKPDGTKTGRALLMMPFDDHLHTKAVSYISSGKLKAAVAKKAAPVGKHEPKPEPKAEPKVEPKADPKPAPKPGNPFEDGEPGSVKCHGRVPDDGPCCKRG